MAKSRNANNGKATKRRTSVSLKGSALRLARAGYQVFPLCPRRKWPVTRNGFHDASGDVALTREFWKREPHANIGIATGVASGIVVIDIDPDNDGEKTLASLEKQHGKLPRTLTAKSGSGGTHYYFSHPGGKIKSRNGVLGPGIDVKADGGYIVAPPSIHPDGGTYRWQGDSDATSCEIAELPTWVLSRLRTRSAKRKTATKRKTTSDTDDNTIPEGERHDTLVRLAGSLHSRGLSPEALAAALLQENETRCDPSLPEEEVAQIASDISMKDRESDPVQRAAQGVPYNRTDYGNAERLVARYGHLMRYCPDRRRWYVWRGKRWECDYTGLVEQFAKQTARAIFGEAEVSDDKNTQRALASFAFGSENASRLSAMLRLTQSQPGMSVRIHEFDTDPWLLNCKNGTLDLRSGKLRRHDPGDLITKLAPVEYDPQATCPTFRTFLQRIFNRDEALIEYVLRLLGYGLTGDIRHHILPIAYGQGANGKSTLFDVVLGMMGDYGQTAPESLVTVRSRDEHPTEIADLTGARLVTASETEEGTRLRVSLVKRLTGDEYVKARYMRGDYFEFRRTHKTILITNKKPRIPENTEAIWRRVKLIPFSVQIPRREQDMRLPQKLRRERAGILAMLVAASLRWRNDKYDLAEPSSVAVATEAYRGDEDSLGEFIDQYFVRQADGFVTRKEVSQLYQRWAGHAGIRVTMGPRSLYERVRELEGVTDHSKRVKGTTQRGFAGLALSRDGHSARRRQKVGLK